ncbi:hypothetical protein HDU91_004346, partial [Kappamyces sp. JEL0680]
PQLFMPLVVGSFSTSSAFLLGGILFLAASLLSLGIPLVKSVDPLAQLTKKPSHLAF